MWVRYSEENTRILKMLGCFSADMMKHMVRDHAAFESSSPVRHEIILFRFCYYRGVSGDLGSRCLTTRLRRLLCRKRVLSRFQSASASPNLRHHHSMDDRVGTRLSPRIYLKAYTDLHTRPGTKAT